MLHATCYVLRATCYVLRGEPCDKRGQDRNQQFSPILNWKCNESAISLCTLFHFIFTLFHFISLYFPFIHWDDRPKRGILDGTKPSLVQPAPTPAPHAAPRGATHFRSWLRALVASTRSAIPTARRQNRVIALPQQRSFQIGPAPWA